MPTQEKKPVKKKKSPPWACAGTAQHHTKRRREPWPTHSNTDAKGAGPAAPDAARTQAAAPAPPTNDQQGQTPRSPLEAPGTERQKEEHLKRNGIAGLSPLKNYTPQYTPPWTTPPDIIPAQQTLPTMIPLSPSMKLQQNIQNHQELLTHTT